MYTVAEVTVNNRKEEGVSEEKLTTVESIYFIALIKNSVLILVSTTKPHEFKQFNITATNKLEYLRVYTR